MTSELEVLQSKLDAMTKRAIASEDDVAEGKRGLLAYRKTLETIAMQRDEATRLLKNANATIRMMIARR